MTSEFIQAELSQNEAGAPGPQSSEDCSSSKTSWGCSPHPSPQYGILKDCIMVREGFWTQGRANSVWVYSIHENTIKWLWKLWLRALWKVIVNQSIATAMGSRKPLNFQIPEMVLHVRIRSMSFVGRHFDVCQSHDLGQVNKLLSLSYTSGHISGPPHRVVKIKWANIDKSSRLRSYSNISYHHYWYH